MGGDYAPAAIVEGAVWAARDMNIPAILVGDRARIESELKRQKAEGLPINVVHASEVVGMGDSPAKAIRNKKDSSIRVCLNLVKRGEADAVVSAGNSGAAMAAAVFVLKRLKGVERPAISVCLPTMKELTVLLDAGGNVDCKPSHLYQFAVMGDVYARDILKRRSPRIGLLSNGEEEGKGNELTRETNGLLRKGGLNYIGYMEGRDIYTGEVDVVVCDGFVGNVVLKTSEGVADAIVTMLKAEVRKSLTAKIGCLIAKGVFRGVKLKIDYSEYGGAPLLGINGTCIISHGGSTAKAIRNAIMRANEYASRHVNTHMAESLERETALCLADSDVAGATDGGERRRRS